MNKKCDHIVGWVDWVTDDSMIGPVFLSCLSNDLYPYMAEAKMYFCPKKGCGSPIDWLSIEKQLTKENV